FHRYNYIYRPIKSAGEWFTARSGWQLRPSEIFKAIACEHKFFIGARAGATTRYAVIDIDKNSPYHNLHSLTRLLHVLDNAGLKFPKLYRSSHSGGWHIYIFFDSPVPTRELRTALVRLFTTANYQVAKGQLEIFPNPGTDGTLGFGIRLPLQIGFAWLDPRDLEVVADRAEMSPWEALSQFLLDMQDGTGFTEFRNFIQYSNSLSSQQTEVLNALRAEHSKKTIPIRVHPRSISSASNEDAVTVIETFGYVPPGMNITDWVRGRNFASIGLTSESQRHDAGFALNHYLFYGDPGRGVPAFGYSHADERAELVKKIVDMKHHGLSKEINNGSREAFTNFERQAHWMPPSKRGLPKAQESVINIDPVKALVWQRSNQKKLREARKDIQEAVEKLVADGVQLSVRVIAESSGRTERTVLKHKDLWIELKTRQFDNLTAGVHDLNGAVEEGAPSKGLPLSTSFEKMPLGRLAARQIVSELRMRIEREARQSRKSQESVSSNDSTLWRESVLKELPVSIRHAETIRLQFVLAFFKVCALTSPDYESQVWLEGFTRDIKRELDERLIVSDFFEQASQANIDVFYETG
ncbi:MAG: hypothetical protein K2Z81_06540, partial [Cyanobacteria bacterium]|nr:hypothetical protein [Cyanobacteriota bacterium]